MTLPTASRFAAVLLSSIALSACFVPPSELAARTGGDGGGYDFACCIDHKQTTCHCPTGLCDAFFKECGGNNCANVGESCADAGTPVDGGRGYDFECCINQQLATCHCPTGLCDAFFLRCGQNRCANPGQGCPDAG